MSTQAEAHLTQECGCRIVVQFFKPIPDDAFNLAQNDRCSLHAAAPATARKLAESEAAHEAELKLSVATGERLVAAEHKLAALLKAAETIERHLHWPRGHSQPRPVGQAHLAISIPDNQIAEFRAAITLARSTQEAGH